MDVLVWKCGQWEKVETFNKDQPARELIALLTSREGNARVRIVDKEMPRGKQVNILLWGGRRE